VKVGRKGRKERHFPTSRQERQDTDDCFVHQQNGTFDPPSPMRYYFQLLLLALLQGVVKGKLLRFLFGRQIMYYVPSLKKILSPRGKRGRRREARDCQIMIRDFKQK